MSFEELTISINFCLFLQQVLDKLRVERERGITVKAQTASVIYKDKETNIEYLLNLIDTWVRFARPFILALNLHHYVSLTLCSNFSG